MAIVIKEIKVVSTVEKKSVSNEQLSPEMLRKIRALIQEESQRRRIDKLQQDER